VRRAALGALVLVMAAASLTAQQQQQQHGRLFRPADLGLLEAPDRDVWQRPDRIMDALQIGDGSVVADIGAGGGWFTIRLADRVGPNGRVFAQDIQPEMSSAIQRRVEREGFGDRVQTVLGSAENPGLPEPVDAILIVDAYHEVAEPVVFLRHLAKSLRPDGRIGIVEFTKSGGGPGPPLDERVDPARVMRDAADAGLVLIRQENFLRYQYLLIFGLPRASGDL
jgi:ubiquinone/menaquinone biosynthesis C-methylase UbiE